MDGGRNRRWAGLFSGGIALFVAVVVPVAWGVGMGALLEPSGAASDGLDIGEGQEHFEALCAVCHAVSFGESALLGPNLAGIGRTGASRRPGLSAPAYILESILEPEAFRAPGASGVMPANLVKALSEESVRNLVAYVAGLGATADRAEIASLPVVSAQPDRVAETPDFRYDPEGARRGRALYEGKGRCVYCHEYERTPVTPLVVPRLSAPVYRSVLHAAITRSNHILNPAYQHYVIETRTGESLQGRILKRNENAILLLRMDDAGTLAPVEIPLSEIARDAEGQARIDPAPLSLVEQYGLSEDEIDALVTFVQFSKAEADE